MSQDLETVKKIYEQSKGFSPSSAPKQGFTGSKCPKCGNKLKKDTSKLPLYAEEGGHEFGNEVISDFKSPPGLYSLSIDHFRCSCGYEFIGAKLDHVEL